MTKKEADSYQVINYPGINPASAKSGIQMPVDILLAIPEGYERPEGFFNLFGAIDQGLGKLGWQAATKIFNPFLWVPGTSQTGLVDLFNETSRPERQAIHTKFKTSHVKKASIPVFPTLENLGYLKKSGNDQFEIIHFHGLVTNTGIVFTPRQPEEPVTKLVHALKKLKTRLLILQLETGQNLWDEAQILAEKIVRAGGPAILTAQGDALQLGAYFFTVYGNILQNRPLSKVGKITPGQNIRAILHCAENTETLLNFDRWLEKLNDTVTKQKITLLESAREYQVARSHLEMIQPSLHRNQAEIFNRRIDAIDTNRIAKQFVNAVSSGPGLNITSPLRINPSGKVTFGRVNLGNSSSANKIFSQGLIDYSNPSPMQTRAVEINFPFSPPHEPEQIAYEAASDNEVYEERAVQGEIEVAPSKSARPQYEESNYEAENWLAGANVVLEKQALESVASRLESIMPIFDAIPKMAEMTTEQKNAPRVLNANFYHPVRQKMVEKYENLELDQEYDLLVDIGPRWDRHISLVTGLANYPTAKAVELINEEEREQGWYDVRVIFVSQEFVTEIVTGKIRLPVLPTGRSIPYQEDGKIASEPAPLVLCVKTPPRPTESLRLHGRLSLYYKNQVLQSAIVDVGAEPGDQPQSENRIEVDFALSDGFQDVANNLDSRAMPGAEEKPLSVVASVMLNDDHSGAHRLLVSGDEKLSPGVKVYNTLELQNILEQARSIFARPSHKEITEDNIETYPFEKFGEDLKVLAKLGRRLYNILIGDVKPTDRQVDYWDWYDSFAANVAKGGVIQFARGENVPPNHIFPLALIYDGKIADTARAEELHLCRLINEQWDSKTLTRKADFAETRSAQCPYQNEHRQNTVCPYHFWGFRNVLEQPLSAFTSRDEWDTPLAHELKSVMPLDLGIAATRDRRSFSDGVGKTHFDNIEAILGAHNIIDGEAENCEQVRQILESPQIVYFLAHGEKSADGNGITYLSIGPHDNAPDHLFSPDLPFMWFSNDEINRRSWREKRPLIFLNGCFTVDLKPEITLNFVSVFRKIFASGVIGTEIPVSQYFAYLAAERFFARFGAGEPAGTAILNMRWDLLNMGSLIGLAYTPYCLADLHLKY